MKNIGEHRNRELRKTIAICALAFIAVNAMACLLGWLGGYNFDSRNASVAEAAWLSFMVSCFAVGGIIAIRNP